MSGASRFLRGLAEMASKSVMYHRRQWSLFALSIGGLLWPGSISEVVLR